MYKKESTGLPVLSQCDSRVEPVCHMRPLSQEVSHSRVEEKALGLGVCSEQRYQVGPAARASAALPPK